MPMESPTSAIDLAYPIAINSYEWAARRYEAIDARIQTILTIGVSVSVGAPVVFSALQFHLSVRWPLVAAAVLFLAALVIGTAARLIGELQILAPKTLYEKWLGFGEVEFK